MRTLVPWTALNAELKHESQRRQRSTDSPERSGTSSVVWQKHVGQAIVQFVQERQRRATSSQRGCSGFPTRRSRSPFGSIARPIEAAVFATISVATPTSASVAGRSERPLRTAAPASEPTSTTK